MTQPNWLQKLINKFKRKRGGIAYPPNYIDYTETFVLRDYKGKSFIVSKDYKSKLDTAPVLPPTNNMFNKEQIKKIRSKNL